MKTFINRLLLSALIFGTFMFALSSALPETMQTIFLIFGAFSLIITFADQILEREIIVKYSSEIKSMAYNFVKNKRIRDSILRMLDKVKDPSRVYKFAVAVFIYIGAIFWNPLFIYVFLFMTLELISAVNIKTQLKKFKKELENQINSEIQ